MCIVTRIRYACCESIMDCDPTELPIVGLCQAAIRNGTIRPHRDDSRWTGCSNRNFDDTDHSGFLKPYFPLLCNQCQIDQRFGLVRNNAQKCFEFLEKALFSIEDRRIDIPPQVKTARVRALLLLPEVAICARLSVNPHSTEAQRAQNRTMAEAAYRRYVSALGSLQRIQWIVANHPSSDVAESPAVLMALGSFAPFGVLGNSAQPEAPQSTRSSGSLAQRR
ncbi:hypothetical protein F5144DRAFT_571298 [Chaetomium tenue]|uniref:Uncharacterized protein n=1 Tax=Chaetomium tenue TaxID=1854479 RepID=A0ACB7P665_9PEZI|nr:hypothetical protein F5144DRAFT_571298 [Chaetomium globosum]